MFGNVFSSYLVGITFLQYLGTPVVLSKNIKPRHDSLVTTFITYTRLGSIPVDDILEVLGDSVDKTVRPDNIYHGAVVAFGKVYDYIINKGIIITNEPDYLRDNSPYWKESEFFTEKSEPEFTNWIKEQKLKNFTPTNYDLAENNCLTFVAKAIEFLGGTEPTRLLNQRQFALNNRESMGKLMELGKPIFI